MASISSYLRKTFLLYDALPVQELPGSNDNEPILTDGSLPLTPAAALDTVKDLEFPPAFLWGTATAAYQIEGGLDHNNWSEWEQRGSRADGRPTVEGHETAGPACNGWELFDQDLQAMKQLGLKMYRFSVEWSRIEPECGEFDEAALNRYCEWCQKLKQAGIEPMVTLHHFTEPAWFGGWEERGNLQHWQRFVQRTTEKLAPHCRHWTTLNEPNGYAICGWLAGVHPPGKVNDLLGMLKVVRHLLVAHTMASNAIRASSALLPHDPVICMALSHVYFLPFDSSQQPRPQVTNLLALLGWTINRLLSSVVSLFLNYVFNLVFLDALFKGGRFPNVPFPFQLAATLAGWSSDLQALEGTCDWIGINHYYRSYVQFGRRRNDNDNNSPPQQASPTDMFLALPFLGLELKACAISQFEKNEMGWDLTPSSMIRLVEIMADRYPHTPILITESGTADATDQKRVRYIAALLKQLHGLMLQQENKRVDLRGYLIWTLLDNFEWAEGFRPKFGLLETNFDTFQRTERTKTCDMLRSVFGNKK